MALNNSKTKKLSDLEMNKTYKIHDTNVKYSHKFKTLIVYLTVELDGENCEISVPEKYYVIFDECDPKFLINQYVKVISKVFTFRRSFDGDFWEYNLDMPCSPPPHSIFLKNLLQRQYEQLDLLEQQDKDLLDGQDEQLDVFEQQNDGYVPVPCDLSHLLTKKN